MAERFVKKTIKSDYVGSYVEYLYADGHRETDPPNRPLTKEDVQRQRLEEAAGIKAKRQLEEQKAKSSAYGSTTPAHIVRENLVSLSGRDLTATYHNTLHSLETIGDTLRGSQEAAKILIENYDLGGTVVGERAGQRSEYGDPVPDRTEEGKPGVKERRYPGRLR